MPMKPGSTKNLLLRLDPALAKRLEVADLVVVAGRTLELNTGQVLDLLDPVAAEVALAQARPRGDAEDPAWQAAALLRALVQRRPLRRGNQQVALAAMLQLLALNGWEVDPEPADATLEAHHRRDRDGNDAPTAQGPVPALHRPGQASRPPRARGSAAAAPQLCRHRAPVAGPALRG